MKENELMIGDRVNCNGANVRIISVGLFQVEIADSINDVYSAFAKDLVPIPLTAEILDKNFKSVELPDDPYGVYFFDSDDYIEVYIKEYTDGLWQVDVAKVEIGVLPTWRMFVSNVHELQHALRFCGIEKDIELK